MGKDQFAELFELSMIGAMASMFRRSGVTPSDEEWAILRGNEQLTLRDISEMSTKTGHTPTMEFYDTTHLEEPTT